jgi:hypothetical protein
METMRALARKWAASIDAALWAEFYDAADGDVIELANALADCVYDAIYDRGIESKKPTKPAPTQSAPAKATKPAPTTTKPAPKPQPAPTTTKPAPKQPIVTKPVVPIVVKPPIVKK